MVQNAENKEKTKKEKNLSTRLRPWLRRWSRRRRSRRRVSERRGASWFGEKREKRACQTKSREGRTASEQREVLLRKLKQNETKSATSSPPCCSPSRESSSRSLRPVFRELVERNMRREFVSFLQWRSEEEVEFFFFFRRRPFFLSSNSNSIKKLTLSPTMAPPRMNAT